MCGPGNGPFGQYARLWCLERASWDLVTDNHLWNIVIWPKLWYSQEISTITTIMNENDKYMQSIHSFINNMHFKRNVFTYPIVFAICEAKPLRNTEGVVSLDIIDLEMLHCGLFTWPTFEIFKATVHDLKCQNQSKTVNMGMTPSKYQPSQAYVPANNWVP